MGVRLRGLPPVDTPGARVLVLGSFPSQQSLERGEYYAHPRNHFWPMLASIAVVALPGSWPEKAALLERLGISLWDLVASCERPGSLDADISGEILNPIAEFVAGRPSIERIALNGGAASTFFAKRFAPERGMGKARSGQVLGWRPPDLGGRSILVARLPSTSPIPTARFRAAADKLPLWASFIRGVPGS